MILSAAPTPLHLRWLWWWHTWTFQAAHKPLCLRYQRDVLRLGSLHLCRSCAALYGSFALALIAAPLYWAMLDARIGCFVTTLLIAIVAASAPPIYRHASRPLRDVLRGGLGSLGGISLVLLFTPAWLWGLANLAGLAVSWRVYQRKRNAQHSPHNTCAGCPEYGGGDICSGYKEQACHLRAYEEAATDWLEKGDRNAQFL